MTQNVEDDFPLLELMMKDTQVAPPQYRPTNYWKVYEERFLPELRTLGLKDYRRRRNSVLSSFGGTDNYEPFVRVDINRLRYINNRLFRKIPGWSGLIKILESKIEKTLVPHSAFASGHIEEMAITFCESEGKKVADARSLSEISMSQAGNPEDIMKLGDNVYSTSFLKFYLAYVYAAKFVNFNTINTVAELGSGGGCQAELLLKCHPHLKLMLFDIPPQLYVAEQYLKTVFPGKVVSYKETREWESLDQLEEGKIHIIGNWKFDLLKSASLDLFWNAASFQEMEPNVVENYLSVVQESTTRVFLQQTMEGKHKASMKGQPGVMTPTTLDHYKAFLSPFELIDISPTLTPMQGSRPDYDNSFWVQK